MEDLEDREQDRRLEEDQGEPERKGPWASIVWHSVTMYWASSIHIFIWPFFDYV
jgi:hypothetical protein